jgi:hypothetical protein
MRHLPLHQGLWWLLLLPFLQGCPSKDGSRQRELSTDGPPMLIIIGEDLSQTFEGFMPITQQDLNAICTTLSNSGRGGKVILSGIGNPTPRGYLTCLIRPIEPLAENYTLVDKRNHERRRERIGQTNRETISRFLTESEDILQRGQGYTDINGFFRRCATLVDSPGLDSYSKWIYVNSDGKQSTRSNNVLDCNLRPTNIDGFFASGWSVSPDCNPDGRFLSPQEFAEYLEQQLRE